MLRTKTVTNFYRPTKHDDAFVEVEFSRVVNETLAELEENPSIDEILDVTPLQSLNGDYLVLTAVISFEANDGYIDDSEIPALGKGKRKVTERVFNYVKKSFENDDMRVGDIEEAFDNQLSRETIRKIIKTDTYKEYYK